MRILHVTTEYPPVIYGGLGTAVAGLVKASARAGLDIAVLLVGAGSMPAYEVVRGKVDSDRRQTQDGDAFSFKAFRI